MLVLLILAFVRREKPNPAPTAESVGSSVEGPLVRTRTFSYDSVRKPSPLFWDVLAGERVPFVRSCDRTSSTSDGGWECITQRAAPSPGECRNGQPARADRGRR